MDIVVEYIPEKDLQFQVKLVMCGKGVKAD